MTNTDCSHPAWPPGTSTSLLHERACLGKTIPKDPACRGSLCSPTQSTYVPHPYAAAWHFQEKRRSSPITSQTSQAAAHVPAADMGELWVSSTQPSPPAEELWIYTEASDSSGRGGTINMSPSKNMRPVWVSTEIQSCVLSYGQVLTQVSPLAAMESISSLLSIQTFLAEPEGILMLALVCINNTTVQSH